MQMKCLKKQKQHKEFLDCMKKFLIIISISFLSVNAVAEFEEDVTGTSGSGSVYGTVDKETGETELYDKNGNEQIIDTDQAIDGTVEEENSENSREKTYSLDQETN